MIRLVLVVSILSSAPAATLVGQEDPHAACAGSIGWVPRELLRAPPCPCVAASASPTRRSRPPRPRPRPSTTRASPIFIPMSGSRPRAPSMPRAPEGSGARHGLDRLEPGLHRARRRSRGPRRAREGAVPVRSRESAREAAHRPAGDAPGGAGRAHRSREAHRVQEGSGRGTRPGHERRRAVDAPRERGGVERGRTRAAGRRRFRGLLRAGARGVPRPLRGPPLPDPLVRDDRIGARMP